MFAVSDRAIFVRETVRGFVRANPWRFKRISVKDVRAVEVVRLKPYGWYFLAAVFLVGALAGFWPIMVGEGGTIKGAHFAALAAGLVIPFVARGRRAICIRAATDSYVFKPPFVVDRASRKHVSQIVEWFVGACRQAGVPVTGG